MVSRSSRWVLSGSQFQRLAGGILACAAAAFLIAGGAAAGEPCGKSTVKSSIAPGLHAAAGHLAAGEPVRILTIGSSSTEGIGATDRRHSYPAQLTQRLRAAWPSANIEVSNAGIGGETADQTLDRLKSLMTVRPKPDLVLWQVGTNDAVRGADEEAFKTRLRRGISLVRDAGVDLILVDQQFFPGIKDVGRYERYVRTIEAIGTAARVTVFSRYALMRGWAAEEPGLLAGMLSGDRFHMSDKGYACLANSLSRLLVESIDRQSPRMAGARGRHAGQTVASAQ